jgi:hypothetical protein
MAIRLALLIALAAAGCSSSPGPSLRVGAGSTPAVSASGPTAEGPPGTSSSASSPAIVRVRAVLLPLRLPIAVSRAVAFADSGSALLVGGLTASGTTSAILRLALPGGPVSPAGRLAIPVHDAAGATLAGSPVVLGGGNVAPVAAVQGLSGSIGTLPMARADLAAVELDGVLYVVGGGTAARLDTAVLATTDGAHFATSATLLLGVRYPAVASVGGEIIVVGGTDGSHDRRAIQAVDPLTGFVRHVGDLPNGLSHAAALVVDGHLLVAGGRVAGKAERAIWEVDPTSGHVVHVGDLPQPVSDATAVVLDGVGYLIGGERDAEVTDIVAITAG